MERKFVLNIHSPFFHCILTAILVFRHYCLLYCMTLRLYLVSVEFSKAFTYFVFISYSCLQYSFSYSFNQFYSELLRSLFVLCSVSEVSSIKSTLLNLFLYIVVKLCKPRVRFLAECVDHVTQHQSVYRRARKIYTIIYHFHGCQCNMAC